MYFVHSTDKHSELNFSVVIPLEQLLDVRSKIDTAIDQLLTKMASQEDPRARVGKIHDPAWRLVEQEPEVQDDEEEPKVQDDEEEPKVQDD